ncbi:GNAT family N-acetyltransferase [Polyangium aurulentum]|uniref:GNAT family N-acetyltransferase n=1 Tax=Polyangium aurulentum TaxID=2567896 RepID=UPI0010AE88A5|nr:GNAT family N-acetyltransferase [Polyangium aurulentum]UQA62314.1 GNAT family N-acetyltransferase [Polyangium aurulentum]
MKTETLEVEVTRLVEPGPDAPAIEAIARESFEGPSFSPLEELSRAWARVWIARAGEGEPVGFLVAWHVADELHVLNVASASAARRRGIGSALVREAIAYAVESRVRLVLLEVRRSNTPAIRLYRKFAFHTSGLRAGYYADGEDAVEMALALDPDTGQSLAREDEISLDT